MSINVPHILVTAAVIAAIVYGVEHTPMLAGASRGKRALITGVAVFVVLFIINLLWPYRS